MHTFGYPDREPLTYGGEPAQYMAGLNAFFAALIAVHHAHLTGHGQHVDLSIMEALTTAHGQALVEYEYTSRLAERRRGGSVFPCKDGFIRVVDQQPRQWERFAALVGAPELIDNPQLSTAAGRRLHMREIAAVIGRWTRERTGDEVYHLAQAEHVPASYPATTADLLASPQLRARGFFVEIDHPTAGRAIYPGAPYQIGDLPWVFKPAPQLGEHNIEVKSKRPVRPANTHLRTRQQLPLAGVRLLDLGMFWAGPYAGRLLAAAGAEVIKVESTSRPDPLRVLPRGLFPDGIPGAQPWNRSGMVNERNRDKLGITLDLRTFEGATIFKDLVRISDVVLENFSTRVMKGFGLGYDTLSHINPQLIMISMSSQGTTGPEREYVSIAPIISDLSGFSALSGYTDEPPGSLTAAYPDPVGAVGGAGAVVAALLYRDRTGRGVHIDLSQREMMISLLGESVLELTMNGHLRSARGNHHSQMAPCDVYRCKGEDEWIAIAVTDTEEWRSLCTVIGCDNLAADLRFADIAGRQQHQDTLRHVIEAWTRNMEHREAMAVLQRSGVPAGAVLHADELLTDPHLEERGYFETVTHSAAGTHRYQGYPMKLSSTPIATRLPAPLLGEHNAYALGDLLGMPRSQIDELDQTRVIGNMPMLQVEI